MEICYETKVLRIFQLFDVNRDGVLSRDELAALAIAVNPQVNFSNEEINAIVDEVFYDYGELIDGETGLTYEGMLWMYDDGAGDIDREFDTLGFDRKPNEGKDSDNSSDVMDELTVDPTAYSSNVWVNEVITYPIDSPVNIVVNNCATGWISNDFKIQVEKNGGGVDDCLNESGLHIFSMHTNCSIKVPVKVTEELLRLAFVVGPGFSIELLWDPGGWLKYNEPDLSNFEHYDLIRSSTLKRPSSIDNSDLICDATSEDSTMGIELHDAIVEGITGEFRVVRDNRNTQTGDREMKPLSAPSSISTNDQLNANFSQKSSSAGTSNNQRPPAGRQSSQHLNGPTDSRVRQVKETGSSGTDRNDTSTERRSFVSNIAPSGKQNDSPNNSVVGVFSSSSDPVHVPLLDSRQAANVGAIKREVGAVGARRQTSENSSSKMTSGQASSSSKEISRSFTAISKSDQLAHTSVAESAVPIMPVSKPFLNNQHNNRSHQQVASHQKAPQPNKEWKPKSSQKPSAVDPGVIGTPTKSSPPAAPKSKDLSAEADLLQDKLSRANIHENQNVIIAAHIRVSETDRCRLTFGSLGTVVDSSTGFQTNDSAQSNIEPSASVSLSPPESSSDDASVSKKVESLDERVQSSGSISSPSGGASEHQLADRRESPHQQNLENYADIALVRDNTPSYTPDLQQQQDPSELQNFAAYDSQGSYDIPYFRSAVDESVRGQVLSIPHEVLVSHANAIPASTIAMVQQQQAPMAQMYPPVHVSHYASLLPYRQFISPMYGPPIATVPGYSNNPAAYSPHPSNGSSYLLMPGANSPHLTANGLKYGIQQFKPIPTGGPTGFGNFTSPTDYAINAPGVVGSAAGLDDSSRLKYKDGNLYLPNPQAETSELWMNPRDIPSMQSAASYYTMSGQTPHAAYMPSHASFNAAAQPSSHMQFQGGMYHHPQAQTANPHHMGGGNVGVGVAPGGAPPGGAYQQQPQLGHMNWSGNF